MHAGRKRAQHRNRQNDPTDARSRPLFWSGHSGQANPKAFQEGQQARAKPLGGMRELSTQRDWVFIDLAVVAQVDSLFTENALYRIDKFMRWQVAAHGMDMQRQKHLM